MSRDSEPARLALGTTDAQLCWGQQLAEAGGPGAGAPRPGVGDPEVRRGGGGATGLGGSARGPLTRPGRHPPPLDDCPTPGLSELASSPQAQAVRKTGPSPWVGGGHTGGGTQRSGGTRLRTHGEGTTHPGGPRGDGRQGQGARGTPRDRPQNQHLSAPSPQDFSTCLSSVPGTRPALTASS